MAQIKDRPSVTPRELADRALGVSYDQAAAGDAAFDIEDRVSRFLAEYGDHMDTLQRSTLVLTLSVVRSVQDAVR